MTVPRGACRSTSDERTRERRAPGTHRRATVSTRHRHRTRHQRQRQITHRQQRHEHPQPPLRRPGPLPRPVHRAADQRPQPHAPPSASRTPRPRLIVRVRHRRHRDRAERDPDEQERARAAPAARANAARPASAPHAAPNATRARAGDTTTDSAPSTPIAFRTSSAAARRPQRHAQRHQQRPDGEHHFLRHRVHRVRRVHLVLLAEDGGHSARRPPSSGGVNSPATRHRGVGERQRLRSRRTANDAMPSAETTRRRQLDPRLPVQVHRRPSSGCPTALATPVHGGERARQAVACRPPPGRTARSRSRPWRSAAGPPACPTSSRAACRALRISRYPAAMSAPLARSPRRPKFYV